MKTSHRILKNTGILYIRMALTLFLSLYSTRLLLGSLGAQDYGIFTVIGGAVAMLGFLNGTMAASTQRFMSYAQGQANPHVQRQIFTVSISMHIVIGLAMVVLLELCRTLLVEDILTIETDRLDAATWVFHFVVASTFFTVLAVPYDAVVIARENMLIIAVIGLAEALMKLGIAITVSITSMDKLWVYGASVAIMHLLLLFGRMMFCHCRYDECKVSYTRYFSFAQLKSMSAFGGWTLLSVMAGMVANYGQGIVLNRFFGSSINASQGVAGQLSGQLSALAISMLKALSPVIAKSEGAGDRQMMMLASATGAKLAFALSAILFVPALIEMPYFLDLWLDDVPAFAIVFCQLLLIRQLVEQLQLTLVKSIEAVGNIRAFNIALSLLSFAPLPVSILLFLNGSAPYYLYIIFLIFTIVSLIVTIFFSRFLFSLNILDYLRNVVAKCVCVFCVSFAVGEAVSSALTPSFLRFICVGLATFVTSTISWWSFGLTIHEKKMVTSVIDKIMAISKLSAFKNKISNRM